MQDIKILIKNGIIKKNEIFLFINAPYSYLRKLFLWVQIYFLICNNKFKANLGYFFVFLRTLVRKGSLCESVEIFVWFIKSLQFYSKSTDQQGASQQNEEFLYLEPIMG